MGLRFRTRCGLFSSPPRILIHTKEQKGGEEIFSVFSSTCQSLLASLHIVCVSDVLITDFAAGQLGRLLHLHAGIRFNCPIWHPWDDGDATWQVCRSRKRRRMAPLPSFLCEMSSRVDLHSSPSPLLGHTLLGL